MSSQTDRSKLLERREALEAQAAATQGVLEEEHQEILKRIRTITWLLELP